MKNILITNSRTEKNQFLIDLLEGLKEKKYSYFLLSSSSDLLLQFQQNKWEAKKKFLGPNLDNKFNFYLFIIILPFLRLWNLFVLVFYKFNKNIDTIICLNWNEKIIFSYPARLLKIKIIWFEFPDEQYQKKPILLSKLFRSSSREAKIISFNYQKRWQLQSMKLKDKAIEVLLPGIKYKKAVFQDNIFNNIAQIEKSDFNKKYFTLGTVTDFEHPNQIETLLQTAKICLDVVPNIQIIIVGDGVDRKQVAWNAKKMGVEHLLWMVGRQEHLSKWLSSFDIYISVCENPKLMDMKLTLRAMLAGLPVIGYSDRGQDDIIRDGNTGFLVEAGDSDILANQIIKLHQNKLLLSKIGRNAKAMVEEQFGVNVKIKEFESLLKN